MSDKRGVATTGTASMTPSSPRLYRNCKILLGRRGGPFLLRPPQANPLGKFACLLNLPPTHQSGSHLSVPAVRGQGQRVNPQMFNIDKRQVKDIRDLYYF